MTEVPGSDWLAGQDDKAALKQAPTLKGVTRWHRKAGVVTHVFTHFPLELVVYTANVAARARAPEGMRWVPIATLADEALPNVMRKVIAHGLGSLERFRVRRSAADTMLAAGAALGRGEPEVFHDRNRARPFHRTAIAQAARLALARRTPERRLDPDLASTASRRSAIRPASVQGGILSAMLDDTMGPAVFVMTEGKLYTATITMTVNFLAPAKPGPITGEADVTQLGKTVAFVEGRLMAEDGTRARDRHDQRAAGRDGESDSASRGLARAGQRCRADSWTIGGLALRPRPESRRRACSWRRCLPVPSATARR